MDIKKKLNQYNLRPNTNAGQHFLLNQEILNEIVQAAELSKKDKVLEIGSGPGNLTVLLAESAGRVIAVESDKRIIPVLRDSVKDITNVEIIQSDIFKWRNQAKLEDKDYKIVANLPYYITAKILRTFLSQPPKPSAMTILVQKEVADRLTAPPGQMSLLSVSVQYYAKVYQMCTIPSSAFWPRPEVDSALIFIEKIRDNQPEDRDFFRLARIGFSSRRKQLHNNLRAGLSMPQSDVLKVIEGVGLKKTARPQELSIEDWKRLSQSLKAHKTAGIGKIRLV